jgi:hypothetical protein
MDCPGALRLAPWFTSDRLARWRNLAFGLLFVGLVSVLAARS